MPNLVRLYLRVLGQLGPEARLGWLLALANVGLAAAQFAEPVLLGRIIDALARAQPVVFTALTTLVIRKAEGLQGSVGSHYSSLAERTSALRILVLEGGRVVESGGFDELVARGGRFAALATTQLLVAAS